MADVSQADFTRAVRTGVAVTGDEGDIELVVRRLSTVSRTAVRKVHRESPAAARAYFARMVAQHLLAGGGEAAMARGYGQSLDTYIGWDGGSGSADLDVGLRRDPVFFGANSVRAIAHVVHDHGEGGREARILLWDELPLDQRAAEIIALPIVERVDANFGAGATTDVEVWQLAQRQRYSVLPATAQAQRPEVEAILAQFP
jgi:hypothetical protein